MPNLTISIPEDVYDKMKKHPEIRWSVVIGRFLREYLRKLEARHEVSARELLEELGIEKELESIPDDVAIAYGLGMVEKRAKRSIRY